VDNAFRLHAANDIETVFEPFEAVSIDRPQRQGAPSSPSPPASSRASASGRRVTLRA
jgi:hypothetical protein